MARKPAQTAVPEQITVEREPLDLTGLETGDELHPALERLYAEMGQDEFGKIKVYIYKIQPDTGKEPRVWEGVPGDYDLMSVAKRFGSGDYRVKVYGPHASGRHVVFANTVFPILLDPSEDARIVAQREGKETTAQVAQTSQTMSPETLALTIAQAIKAAMPQQSDPLAQMDRIASIMQKVMPMHNAPQQNNFTETLTAARALLELSRGFGGVPTDDSGRADVKGHALARGIDLVTRLFEKSVEQAGARVGGDPSQPNPTSLPAPQQHPNGAENVVLTAEQIEELEMMRLQIKMVNRQAANNVEPGQLVKQYYDQIPDDVFDLVVFSPQWFDVMTQNVPECAQHKDWYIRLRAALIQHGVEVGDLKSNPDGTLEYVEEGETADGVANA